MKTIYYTAASLDGFIAGPDNSLDWLFKLEGEGDRDYPEFIKGIGAIAMGSTTYEWILAHDELLEAGKPWPYEQPCWIFTTRKLPAIPGADIRFVQGDVRPVHAEMAKAAGGRNIWLVGGGELVGQFHDHGLLDELVVTIGSVTLGAGAPILPRAITTPPLVLESAFPMPPGFVQLKYRVDHG
ncbi:MAG TPA: dihydrofolate reductase family protein [Gemmatimonadales bacterium]|nr:dihydrofolate reductase family protein [Gemmatimonadales bacterium]